jgi:hypothetical protein
LCNPRGDLSTEGTHLAPVASLPGPRRGLQLFLDGIREFLGMLSFNNFRGSPVGLPRTRSLLRHVACKSLQCAGRSRGVEGRSRAILKPSNVSFWELGYRPANANVLDWRCRIQREGVVLLFDALSLGILRGEVVEAHSAVGRLGWPRH